MNRRSGYGSSILITLAGLRERRMAQTEILIFTINPFKQLCSGGKI
jgi:hypothetical protein